MEKKREKIGLFERIFHKKELYFLRGEVSALYKTVSILSETHFIFNHYEKVMILDALCCDEYSNKVSEPKTKHFIRQVYKDLKEKIKITIKEPEIEKEKG